MTIRFAVVHPFATPRPSLAARMAALYAARKGHLTSVEALIATAISIVLFRVI